MYTYIELLTAFLITLGSTFLLTYPVKKLAVKWHVVDFPNARKIHKKVTPRLGGLPISLGVFLGALYLQPTYEHHLAVVLGAIIIIITGFLDDRYNIRPVIKLSGQCLAALSLIASGLLIEKVTLPFVGQIDFGFWSVLITLLWVIGITNAINLIDGLDGLAAGITTIALVCILTMALIDGRPTATALAVILIGSNIGFLYHNFYPAKIYMGDSGSNFLGYMIAVISMLDLFKNITLFSFIIPFIILAVPIFDTFLAIIRRLSHKKSIMQADRKHIHYRLLDEEGYSHRQTVLIIYIFSALFGVMGILFSEASFLLSLIILTCTLLLLYLFAELAGLVFHGRRPVIHFILKPWQRREKDEEQSSRD